MKQKAKCIWLTGLPCSGKTTIAKNLQLKLTKHEIVSSVLDGNELRSSINSDLGFDIDSRNEAMRRVACLANMLYKQNITTIISVISPLKAHRSFAKNLFPTNESFFEIYLSTDLAVCEKRDVKGEYKKARENKIKNFTGIGSIYESPDDPFISLDTNQLSLDECIAIIYEKIFINN